MNKKDNWYKKDLAYIHDVGFSEFALKSASAIIEILQENNLKQGLIVDLGCGCGLSARELVKANYQVLGDDNNTFVAYVPAIEGCQAWGETSEKARAGLDDVFAMIQEEYREMDRSLPQDVELVIADAS